MGKQTMTALFYSAGPLKALHSHTGGVVGQTQHVTGCILKVQHTHSVTDLHVHGDRDLLLMSSLPSGTEGTTEEMIRDSQPGRRRGGSTLEQKETTHDALQHTCREK